MTANVKLEIPLFDEHDADSLNRVQSAFEAEHQFLFCQAEGSGTVTNSLVDSTTFSLKELHDSICRQLRKRLNTRQNLLFQLTENGILQATAQSKSVIAIPKSLQQSAIRISHHTRIAGHSGGRKMF